MDESWIRANFPTVTNVAPVGKGGQKIVFCGTHPTDGSVVIKAILSSKYDERIAREILAVQQISSPRVPIIHETGAVGTTLWLREQRVDGRSLRELLIAGERISDPADLLKFAIQVLEALKASEEKKIVHRDVKPDNLMVDQKSDYWLLDFGLARHLDLDSLTASNALGGPGTLGYAPEEQYKNKKREIDGRADLFALGVTIWEMCNGVHPYRDGARDRFEVIRRIEGTTPARLALPGPLGVETSGFVATLMQRRADHRPASVSEALDWARSLLPPP